MIARGPTQPSRVASFAKLLGDSLSRLHRSASYRSCTDGHSLATMRARLAAAAAAAVLLTGCAGTAVDELPPSALESMEALAAFAREQNDGELAPVVSTPHQHKIEHFVVLLKVSPSLVSKSFAPSCRP